MWVLFWIMVAIMAGVYLAMLFWTLPALEEMAGGLAPFDMRPGGYTFAEAAELVSALGPEGRDYYLTVQHGLDAVFPALFSVVLVLALYRVYEGWVGHALALTAIAAGTFDYFENSAVAAMLWLGPDGLTAAMAAEASRWTVLKSAATAVALLGLVVGLARRRRRR